MINAKNPCRVVEEAVKLANEIMKMTTEQLETKKSEQQKTLPIIRKARELDLQIIERDVPIKVVNDSITELSKFIEITSAKQNSDCANLNIKCKALQDLLCQLKAKQTDEGLVEHLSGIQSRFEAFRGCHDQLLEKHNEIEQTTNQFQRKHLRLARTIRNFR